jgi:hypothetical protein
MATGARARAPNTQARSSPPSATPATATEAPGAQGKRRKLKRVIARSAQAPAGLPGGALRSSPTRISPQQPVTLVQPLPQQQERRSRSRHTPASSYRADALDERRQVGSPQSRRRRHGGGADRSRSRSRRPASRSPQPPASPGHRVSSQPAIAGDNLLKELLPSCILQPFQILPRTTPRAQDAELASKATPASRQVASSGRQP